MYERFTDRSRKVMQLANQQARSFNHEYIGTEHILLGLVSEGTGVAANVLANLGVGLDKIRDEVNKIVQAGPDMVAMERMPQTPRAKKVIEYAIEESRKLNHNYVGTEHLLLGLLRENESVAAQVLMNLGLELSKVQSEVRRLLGDNIAPPNESQTAAEEGIVELTTDSFAITAKPKPVELTSAPPLRESLAVDWLTQLIQIFIEMKEEAVCLQDFERAAKLRDDEKKLHKIREWLLKNKDRDLPSS